MGDNSTRKPEGTCKTCKYYFRSMNQCRINPPVYDDGRMDCFPNVFDESFCGKYKPVNSEDVKFYR